MLLAALQEYKILGLSEVRNSQSDKENSHLGNDLLGLYRPFTHLGKTSCLCSLHHAVLMDILKLLVNYLAKYSDVKNCVAIKWTLTHHQRQFSVWADPLHLLISCCGMLRQVMWPEVKQTTVTCDKEYQNPKWV